MYLPLLPVSSEDKLMMYSVPLAHLFASEIKKQIAIMSHKVLYGAHRNPVSSFVYWLHATLGVASGTIRTFTTSLVITNRILFRSEAKI